LRRRCNLFVENTNELIGTPVGVQPRHSHRRVSIIIKPLRRRCNLFVENTNELIGVGMQPLKDPLCRRGME